MSVTTGDGPPRRREPRSTRLAPTGLDRRQPAYVRWIPDGVPSAAYLPEGDAQRAASLAGETLRIVFGVDDARSVIIRI